MAVTGRPRTKSLPDDAAVEKLISKGGSVASEQAAEEEQKLASVLVRLPVSMLTDVDVLVKRRQPIRITRQTWLLDLSSQLF